MKRIVIFAILAVTSSCQPSGFNGSNAVAKKASAEAKPQGKPQPKPTIANENPSPFPSETFEPSLPKPSPCTDAGTTVAKLISTAGIVNDSANQFLEYELSMEDCEGVVTPITANVILFDLDAESESGAKPLPYQLKSPDGMPISNGILASVSGSDLFGVVGPARFHHRTNNNINVPSTHRKVRLIVDLSFTNSQPLNSGLIGPVARAIIPSFLRFGQASPVKTLVPFITNGI